MADLIYEQRHVAPLVRLIGKMLAPVGVCLLTDQDRVPSAVLRQTADRRRACRSRRRCSARASRAATRFKGTLYRITQPGGTDPLGG